MAGIQPPHEPKNPDAFRVDATTPGVYVGERNETVSFRVRFPGGIVTPQAVVERLRRGRGDPDRHKEILEATLAELQEVGYDRMTMDGVARRASASKATLYRHWPGKPELVVSAINSMKGADADVIPNTGSLRGDLLALLLSTQRHAGNEQLCMMRGMVSACGHDPDLAKAFFEQIVERKRSGALSILRRAQQRGEVSDQTDIHFLVDTAPAMLIFRHLLTTLPVDEAFLTRLVDEVWMPLLSIAPVPPVATPTSQ
jgi:AcrR family transcriptional regulator